MASLNEVGLGVTIAVIILREVFNFLKERKDPRGSCYKLIGKDLGNMASDLGQVKRQTDTLFSLHNRYDEDGSPLWYVPRSWAKIQADIIDLTREIVQTQKMIASTLERLEAKLGK